MTRLFWLLLGLIIGAIAVWVVSRNQIDSLYAEISRMREATHDV